MIHEINLLDETLAKLENDGYTVCDIEFISLYGREINLDEFLRFAGNYNYNPGYGCAECPQFIIKLTDGSWFEREEYDGSEWWRHVMPPVLPTEQSSIRDALFGNSWLYSLVELEDEEWRLVELEDEERQLDELEERYEHVRTAPVGDNEEIMSRRYRREWRELHPSRCWKDQRKRAHSWER